MKQSIARKKKNEHREHSTDTGRRENGCYRDLNHVCHLVKVRIDRHAVSSLPTKDSRLAHGLQPRVSSFNTLESAFLTLRIQSEHRLPNTGCDGPI
jgi:hypothetical protein